MDGRSFDIDVALGDDFDARDAVGDGIDRPPDDRRSVDGEDADLDIVEAPVVRVGRPPAQPEDEHFEEPPERGEAVDQRQPHQEGYRGEQENAIEPTSATSL